MNLLILGSSYTLPAHGSGGARARINNSATKKSARPSEDGSAGGFKGGMPSRPSRGEAPPPCSSEQSRAEKRTFPFRRKKSARAKLGKLQSAFFCEAVPLGGTAAGRSVSFAQKRFGFRQTNAPEFDFQKFCRPIQSREARQRTETLARRARRGSPGAGSKSLAILSICFAQ